MIRHFSFHRYQRTNDSFKDLVGFWISNLFMRVPNSVVLPVGTHVDACSEAEVEEKKKDIMFKIQAMLEERQTNLTHLIANLEDNEESEFYEDQWTRVKEMENCTLTVRNAVIYNDLDPETAGMQLSKHLRKQSKAVMTWFLFFVQISSQTDDSYF